ncbi:MAG: tetratricopeptide repeat protein [Gemmatimonadetes bacterium]|nr:tetratricopeptide repeat protein [Gemmatimonadota bacterium]
MSSNDDRQDRSGLGNFWGELRRRHVVRTAGVYVAAAFVVLQAGEIILPAFNTPDWALQSLVVIAALGLPVVLAVAWVWDLTPEGVERTDNRASVRKSAIPRLAFLVVTSAAVGFAAFSYARITFTGPARGAPDGVGSFVSLDADAPISAIAVLPLDNFAEGDDFFARSLHEEIIAQLAELTTLRVVSRTSVERYAETDKLLPEIAQELRVQAIVEGSVTRPADSDTVRITIQLIHAPSDTHLMAETFEREAKDVLRLQRDVAQQIAEAIQGEVTAPQDATPAPTIAAVDPEAHQAFIMGQMELDKNTPDGVEAAVTHFREAIDLDSSYSAAYAGLAGAQLLRGLEGLAPLDAMVAEAHAEAQRAVELGGADMEAEAVMVVIRDHLDDLPPAIREEVEVSFMAPPDSFARTYLQDFTRMGVRARQASLGSSEATSQGLARARLFEAQRQIADANFAGAATLLRQALDQNPATPAAWDALERTHVLQGDYAGAVEVRKERLRTLNGGAPDTESRIAGLEAAFDPTNPSTYWQWLRRDHQDREDSGDYASDVEYAAACVALGDYEDALRNLESALEDRDPALHTLRFDPTWDPLRRDPRFRDISRRIRAALSQGRLPSPATPPG